MHSAQTVTAVVCRYQIFYGFQKRQIHKNSLHSFTARIDQFCFIYNT